MLLATAFYALQTIDSAADESARLSADGIVNGLAGQLESDLQARRDLMALVLADGRIAQVLAARADAASARVEAELQRRLPGALQRS